MMATGQPYNPVLAQPDPPGPPQNHPRDVTNSLEDLLRNSEDDNGSQRAREMTSSPPDPIDLHDPSLSASRPPSPQTPQEDRMDDPGQLDPPVLEQERPIPYRKVIQNAGKVLEHIKNGSVGKRSRHSETSITYYDYIGHFISDTGHIDDSANIPALSHASADVQQRLIFVEDLSKPTINKLGETFSINPEFFEEHLLNSGYAGGEYDSPSARNWSTASFEKSYMSFRWIRPVYRLPTYFSSSELGNLLNDGTIHSTRGREVWTDVLTNIFRLEWGLWTDPRKTVRMKRVCGLEERVSIWKKRLNDRNTEIIIVLFDPLPEISETHQYWAPVGLQGQNSDTDDESDADDDLSQSYEMEEPKRVKDQGSFNIESLYWLIGRGRRKVGTLKSQVLNKVIIEQIGSRQAISVDLDRVFQATQSVRDLDANLKETKSTKLEICDGLHLEPLSLVEALFRIVKQDTMTLLNQLRQILDEIDIEMIDDTKMEDRLSLWRQIINRAQRELPELRSSIEPFIEFLIGLQSITFTTDLAALGPEVTQDKDELLKEIDHIIDRLQTTSTSLTSNMGLLDSRRSIDEAHAVARLTELAFIFIPMSFAASVFGMQVKPFAEPVPLSNFFIVAVVVTSFAYLMRMTMRSAWLVGLKAAVRHDVRRYAARNGQPVQAGTLPVLLVFRSIASRLGTIIIRPCKWAARGIISAAEMLWAVFGFIISFILLSGVASAIPLVILWTCDLDSDIQDAVTIAIVLIVTVIVVIPFWYRSDPKFRNALPDFIMDRVRRAPLWVRKASIYLILIATFSVVPLALIWTRPLATGIKSGLTVGVGMVVMLIVLIRVAMGRRRSYIVRLDF